MHTSLTPIFSGLRFAAACPFFWARAALGSTTGMLKRAARALRFSASASSLTGVAAAYVEGTEVVAGVSGYARHIVTKL